MSVVITDRLLRGRWPWIGGIEPAMPIPKAKILITLRSTVGRKSFQDRKIDSVKQSFKKLAKYGWEVPDNFVSLKDFTGIEQISLQLELKFFRNNFSSFCRSWTLVVGLLVGRYWQKVSQWVKSSVAIWKVDRQKENPFGWNWEFGAYVSCQDQS